MYKIKDIVKDLGIVKNNQCTFLSPSIDSSCLPGQDHFFVLFLQFHLRALGRIPFLTMIILIYFPHIPLRVFDKTDSVQV